MREMLTVTGISQRLQSPALSQNILQKVLIFQKLFFSQNVLFLESSCMFVVTAEKILLS